MAQATGDYELKLSVTASNANEAAQTLRSMFTGIRAEARKTQRDVSLMGSTMNKMMRSFQYAAGTYLGVAGVQQALSSVMQGVRQYSQANVDFQKAIGQLVAQGEKTASSAGIAKTKKEVAQLTAALGVSADEVANFLYSLESGVAGLKDEAKVFSDIKKEVVQLNQLQSINPETFGKAMALAYQNFKEEIRSANILQNQIFRTVERGNIEMDEFARYAPKVFQATRNVGSTLEQGLATITGATLQAGSVEDAITGIKNAILIMDQMHKLERAGVSLTGNVIERLEQLVAIKNANPEALKVMFGQETINTLDSMLDQITLIKDTAKELTELTDSSDVVGDRLKGRIENDPAFLEAKKAEADKQIRENPAEFGKGYNAKGWWGKGIARFEAGRTAQSIETGSNTFNMIGGVNALLNKGVYLSALKKRADAMGGAETELGRSLLKEWFAGSKEYYEKPRLGTQEGPERSAIRQQWMEAEAPAEWFDSEEERKSFNRPFTPEGRELARLQKKGKELGFYSGVTGWAHNAMEGITGGRFNFAMSEGRGINEFDPEYYGRLDAGQRKAYLEYKMGNLREEDFLWNAAETAIGGASTPRRELMSRRMGIDARLAELEETTDPETGLPLNTQSFRPDIFGKRMMMPRNMRRFFKTGAGVGTMALLSAKEISAYPQEEAGSLMQRRAEIDAQLFGGNNRVDPQSIRARAIALNGGEPKQPVVQQQREDKYIAAIEANTQALGEVKRGWEEHVPKAGSRDWRDNIPDPSQRNWRDNIPSRAPGGARQNAVEAY